ncbi:MAG: hypothetical protein LBD01_03555, partial [Puniceicoccales bacterium]|nr:hypothetical protein [Puniceicoccales bacterium]
RKRTDLFIEWPLDEKQGMYGPLQRIVVELKLLRGSLEAVIEQGLEQTNEYADRANADEAHLFIFERESGKTWDEKIWKSERKFGTRDITVWGA